MRHKLYNIFDGWHRYLTGKADIDLTKERYQYCMDCEDRITSINICGLCGCPLAAKVRAKNEKCPKGKW